MIRNTNITFLSLMILLISCHNSTDIHVGDTALFGSLAGSVLVYDTFSPRFGVVRLHPDRIRVQLAGTAYFALTDTSGNWNISNIAPGNYDINFSKSGFGLFKQFCVSILGPSIVYLPPIKLGAQPDDTDIVDSVQVSTNSVLVFGSQSAVTESWTFIGLDSTVGPDGNYLDLNYSQTGASPHWFTSFSRLSDVGIHSGMRVYVSAVIDNSQEYYYDPRIYGRGSQHLTSYGKRSNVISFIMP